MGAFKEKMIRDLKIRGRSPRTLEAYIKVMVEFVKYFMKSPDKLDLNDIHEYQLHLIENRKLAPPSVNMYMGAIKFFYTVTLRRNWNPDLIPKVKRIKKLPVILSPEEITLLLNAAKNIKHQVILMTSYATGLRAIELAHLKAEDIDSSRMLIHVKFGKRRKERYVILSKTLLYYLRRYWQEDKKSKEHWLFPGERPEKPISYGGIRHMFKNALKKSGIKKNVGLHVLRHCFSTHLLEYGTKLRHIQRLLGHTHLSTTTIYTHVVDQRNIPVISPLEAIKDKLN